MEVAEQFGTNPGDRPDRPEELAIETMSQVATLSQARHWQPLAPRLRMLTLYAIGAQ